MGALKIVALALALAGCGGTLQLIPRDGSSFAHGSFVSPGKSIEILIEGKRYAGNYVTNESIFVGSGFGGRSTFMSTGAVAGNQGVALLVASDGDTLRCEFQHQGSSVIGVCQTRDGRMFDMRTN